MIRHIVLFRASDEIKPIIEELRSFCGSFEGIIDFQFGVNRGIEAVVMHGYSYGFTIDFETVEARDRYVAHPEHKAIGAKLVAVCPRQTDDVLVFDLDIAS